jgi:hypothetical protein
MGCTQNVSGEDFVKRNAFEKPLKLLSLKFKYNFNLNTKCLFLFMNDFCIIYEFRKQIKKLYNFFNAIYSSCKIIISRLKLSGIKVSFRMDIL